MDIKEFDNMRNELGKTHKIYVRDNDGKVVREATVLLLSQYFDWDKNDNQQYPHKMTWNNIDHIYAYDIIGMTRREGMFSILNNTVQIVGCTIHDDKKHRYFYQIKDGEIRVKSSRQLMGSFEYKIENSRDRYYNDAMITIEKMKKRLHGMDLSSKELILSLLEINI